VSSYEAAVLYYALGMALLAVAVLSLPFLLGITALFVRYVINWELFFDDHS